MLLVCDTTFELPYLHETWYKGDGVGGYSSTHFVTEY